MAAMKPGDQVKAALVLAGGMVVWFGGLWLLGLIARG